MQHANGSTLYQQWDPEHGPKALFSTEQGIEYIGVIEVVQNDRLATGNHIPSKAPPDRNAHALLDFFLKSFGGTCHQHILAVLIEQQDDGCIDRQQVTDAGQELIQQPSKSRWKSAASVTLCRPSSRSRAASVSARAMRSMVSRRSRSSSQLFCAR